MNIKRFNKEKSPQESIDTFEVENTNLLKALIEIKTKKDNSLTFRCGCKSGVCGSCAIRVNGVEKLACKTNISQNDLIEALKNSNILKDLVVNVSHETLLIEKTKSYISKIEEFNISQKDIKNIDLQSNCILCNSCYSSCPVYDVNKEFLGPFALTRALRYVNDKKNAHSLDIVDSIQSNGIWDCTLCSACTLVCPQGIDPKADIMLLQNISVQNGYSNPYTQTMDFGMDFNDDFSGFNPNGF
ncbi:MAG: succinate dehydrogenase/fumarate reductase iron-sulfur subunit [Aliarcobacter sp.]|nr:succinate dehydrogenase/fumarate reductase iron-sulfur subunit [Aliarcobacter sp.]MBP9615965.1 succinate dehydrogenase/fumarate reductase iron-sulfur subunit [Aliarcobacter sp.]